LPGGKSRSLHHTLSEFYAPLRERETEKGKIELCKENEELICFRQEENLKTKSRKKKPKVKKNQEFGEERREQAQLREEKMKRRTTTKRTGNRDSQKISKARSGRRPRKSMKSEL
jgi:polynucleotide 5'-kinase involved in rRNA processing